MPKITIRERDLTSAGNLEVTTNAVYIPGYSNMGPTNVPTLCETVEDFMFIFGSEPYKFRTQQAWPKAGDNEDGILAGKGFDSNAVPTTDSTMGNMYEEGELEKSYIMAVELLKLGLPVLYERVASEDTIEKWTSAAYISGKNIAADNTKPFNNIPPTAGAGIQIRSTFPGLASEDIICTLNKKIVTLVNADKTTENGFYWIISTKCKANVNLGTREISPVETSFTFNARVAAEFTNCKLVYPNQSLVDNSGLVKLTFENNIKEDTEFIYLDLEDSSKLREYKLGIVGADDTFRATDEFKVEDIYNVFLESKAQDPTTGEPVGLDKLSDKGEYIIKFVTTGAYPVFEFADNTVAQKVIEIAANRGDCTALIDHTPNNSRNAYALNNSSVFSKVSEFARSNVKNELGEDAFTYAAMFTPYGVYTCSSIGKQVMLPASFGYLAALAASVQVNGNWMAAAGVQRGGVPNLVALSQNITNAIADSYQNRDAISINPITNIKPYGLTIWGNRTLKNNAKAGDLTATSFLSIRQLTNDVKRTVYVAAKSLTFEQNNDILWINFKSKIIPTLDQMVSGSGLSGYEIKKQKTTKKATIKAVVRLYAIEPVEDWDITIELADSSTEIVG